MAGDRVLGVVLCEPGITPVRAAAAPMVSRQAVHTQVKRLEADGAIRVERLGKVFSRLWPMEVTNE